MKLKYVVIAAPILAPCREKSFSRSKKPKALILFCLLMKLISYIKAISAIHLQPCLRCSIPNKTIPSLITIWMLSTVWQMFYLSVRQTVFKILLVHCWTGWRLSTYLDTQNWKKQHIATQFLTPRQRKFHGLDEKQLRFRKSAIEEITQGYTREAGVRNLEREIGKVCRKIVTRLVRTKENKITIVAPKLVHGLVGGSSISSRSAGRKKRDWSVDGTWSYCNGR